MAYPYSHRPPYNNSTTYSSPNYSQPTHASPVSPILPAQRARQPSKSTPAPYYYNPYAPTSHDAHDLTSDPFVSPIMSRSPSVAGSDRFSSISGVTGYWPQNPNDVSPPAAYVARFGATQVVNEQRALGRPTASSDDEEGLSSKDDVQFTPQALHLVNAFLDQLLYSVLSTARSTSLYKLRPAVTEVLKHRLAKEAISNADEELQELLAGGEEEEERNTALNSTPDGAPKWDLELVWKRTRLRVMVYMRLGEMEDEDEDRHVKEQELYYGRDAENRRFSADSGLVSWSAAIFLTSVLEYVAEQTLQVAGAAAFSRDRRQSSRRPSLAPGETRPPPISDQVAVEEHDVERVALDARLGRLWRTWRKTQRGDRRPGTPTHKALGSRSSFSRESVAAALRRESSGMLDREARGRTGMERRISQSDVPEMGYPEHVLASNIPLPMQDATRDVDEIEVPGLAADPDAVEGEGGKTQARRLRRKTLQGPDAPVADAAVSFPHALRTGATPVAAPRPAMLRIRSMSVPAPLPTPHFEIPGAFPEEPAEGKTDVIPEKVQENEQKFSAREMAGHKRNSEDAKVLLNSMTDDAPEKAAEREVRAEEGADEEVPVAEAPEINDKETEEDAPEQKAKSDDHKGLLGAAAAGAAVAAGAAGAALSKLSGHDEQSPEQADEVNEEKSLRSDPTLTPEATLLGPTNNNRTPRVRTPREIEELDNRKSLVSLKSLLPAESARASREPSPRLPALDTPPIQPSEPVAPAHLEPPLDVTRSSSVETDKSFTLGQRRSSKEVLPQETTAEPSTAADEDEEKPVSPKVLSNKKPDVAVGMARTSDYLPNNPNNEGEAPVELDATPTSARVRDVPVYLPTSPKARERPERLVLDNNGPRPVENGSQTPKHESAPSSPQDFLQSRNLAASPKVQPQPAQVERVRESPSEKTRASPPQQRFEPTPIVGAVAAPTAPDGIAQPPPAEKGQEYKIWQPAPPVEQKSDPSPKPTQPKKRPSASSSIVQPHPAMNNSPKHDKKPSRTNPAGTPPVAPGATIRGAEDFDDFIKSDDTVKYTLTPETVRDTPRPVMTASRTSGPERVVESPRSNATSLAKLSGQATPGAPGPPPKGPVPLPPLDTRAGRGRATKHVTASSQGRNEEQKTPTSRSQTPTSATPNKERRRSVSKPSVRNSSAHRRSGLTAREPQVLTESTRDFADFIRSTGPDREPELYRLATNRSTGSLASARSGGRERGASLTNSQPGSSAGSTQNLPPGERERTKSLTRSEMVRGDIPPVPPVPTPDSSRKGKSSLQARSATGANAGSSDLINFIRDGPATQDPNDHRISRSVAPFRNTMDSDQFAEMGAPDLNGPASASNKGGMKLGNATAAPRTTSANPGAVPRRSSLVNGNGPTSQPAHSTRAPPTSSAAGAGQDQTRKRYRNKDPYAIDLSDENEEIAAAEAQDQAEAEGRETGDHLTALPRPRPQPKGKREESLADFLRDSEPPANNAPRPISGGARHSLMNGVANGKARGGAAPITTNANPAGDAHNRSRSAAATPGPSAVPKRPAGVPRVEPRAGGAGARLGLAGGEGSGTGDLADFLRSSGPPEPAAPPPGVGGKGDVVEGKRKKRSGIFGWGRRKD